MTIYVQRIDGGTLKVRDGQMRLRAAGLEGNTI